MNEKILVTKLKEKNYHIATAESCTGGMVASTIINVPMASSVINESVVTYANEVKVKYCSVNPKTIEEVGVVSEEVAGQMARGIAWSSKAEVGIGVSGIAGPAGGTDTKPVGMVCFGIFIDGKLSTFTKYFKGSRMAVRKKSTKFAIDKTIELLG